MRALGTQDVCVSTYSLIRSIKENEFETSIEKRDGDERVVEIFADRVVGAINLGSRFSRTTPPPPPPPRQLMLYVQPKRLI